MPSRDIQVQKLLKPSCEPQNIMPQGLNLEPRVYKITSMQPKSYQESSLIDLS